MKKFKVGLEFVDDDDDLITKEVELYFLNQNMINRISEIFGKFEEMRRLYLFIESMPEKKAKIVESKDKVVEKLNHLKAELKEKQIRFAELGSENGVQREKIDTIKEVLKKNKVEDKRFYTDEFWNDCVDPEEMKEFLMGVLLRGKKKVMTNPKKKTTESLK